MNGSVAGARVRIFLGSPVPDPAEGRRVAPATGLVINDSAGAERFGLGLFPNGRVVMGFDAPPGTGDERNRPVATAAQGDLLLDGISDERRHGPWRSR